MKKESDHTYTVSLVVRNRPGVLVRCAQVYGRRGHNIEALHVSGNHKEEAIMTITAFGSPHMIAQIIASLAKLQDVIEVREQA